MHAVVPYSSQQAGGAQSRTIPYRSRRFGIGSSLGYAAFEWLGSTWGLRGWSQQPPGITPMPATQPLSKRPLRLWPRPMTACTIALEWWLCSKSQIKIRSILILSNLKDCRYDKEENPVPKSSIAIFTPSDLSRMSAVDLAQSKPP